jgi:hypothetical protein
MMRALRHGGKLPPDVASLALVWAAAQEQGKGYHEFLWELRQAEQRFGEGAGDLELALTLAWMDAKKM